MKNAPEDWLIFENTHEVIVDPETWQLAQQVKRTAVSYTHLSKSQKQHGLIERPVLTSIAKLLFDSFDAILATRNAIHLYFHEGL